MGYRRKLLFITLIIALSGVFVFEIVQKKVQQKVVNRIFEEFTNRMNDSYAVNKYIDNVSYEEAGLSISYNLQFNKMFSELPVYDQFGVLYTYCKQLRSYIMNSDEMRLLYRSIHLTGNYKDLTYQFDSYTASHGLKSFKPKAVFFINGKPAYEEGQYLALLQDLECEIEIDFINGYSDKEIMEYSLRIFNLITNCGYNVKIEQDFETVSNAVIDKFDITFDEYMHIYRKYYLCRYY